MMAVTPDKVQIGSSNDFLDGVAVDTAAGTGLFRETVVLADPEAGGGLANVRDLSTQLLMTDKGIVTNTIIHGLTTGGGGGYRDVKVNPSGALTVDTGLTQPTTPADTQQVSAASLPLPAGAATEAKQLPDNHQVSVSNFPATQAVSGTVELGATSLAALETVQVGNLPSEYPLPAAQVAALTPQTDALTEEQLRTVVPDETGTWSYYAGAAGSVSVAGRVLQITATAGLVAGSLTINGGATISVPAGKSITIEPRANLSSPAVVFTSTQAYFIEVVA